MYKIREPFSVSWQNHSFEFTFSLHLLLTLLSEERRKKKKKITHKILINPSLSIIVDTFCLPFPLHANP